MIDALMKHTLLALAALVVLGLAGCSSAPKQVWVEEEFEVRTERHLWDVLRLSIDAADYAVGAGAEPEKRRIESGWKVDLHPFKNRGWRKKAHVEYEPLPPTDGELATSRWNVRVRVQMDLNASFRGADPRYADWEPAPDDEAGARFIIQAARSFLGGGAFEVSRP